MSQSQDELKEVLKELDRITEMHDQVQWWINSTRKRFKDLPEVQEGLDASQARLNLAVNHVSMAKERIRRRLAK